MREHVVEQGECLSSIGARYGVPWKKIWEEGANAQLRQKRGNPSVLLPGDVLRIPKGAGKDLDGATETRHQFVKKAEPATLRVKLLIDGKPRKNLPFRILIAGEWVNGNTDGEGLVAVALPPDLMEARLIVMDKKVEDTYDLDLGHLDPLDTDEGACQRLRNLGYPADEDLAEGLRAFQTGEELERSGILDDATRGRLQQRYGQ